MKCPYCNKEWMEDETDVGLFGEEVGSSEEDEPYKPPEMRCSFCGKKHDEVTKLIAGPAVFLCNECLDLCNSIMEEENK